MLKADVSVIIPCYNAAPFLGETLESVLCQTVRAREVIVVDDGSTDGSSDVAKQFGPPVRLICQENAGLAAARNRGIEEARGEWIAFVDADDLWEPHKLEKQLAKAAEGFDFVYCNATNFGDCGWLPSDRSQHSSLPEGMVFEELLLGNFITASGVIAKRALLLQNKMFNSDFKSCEDWALWLELSTLTPFGSVREPLVRYRVHPGAMSKNVETMTHYGLKALTLARSLPVADTVPERVWRTARANVHYVGGIRFELAGKRWPALRQYIRSLTLAPWSWMRWKALLRTILKWEGA